MCGRRWGKTLFGILEGCEALLDGKRVGFFAPTYKYAMEAWRTFKDFLSSIIGKSNEQEMRLETVSGGVLEIWSLDKPDAGRSRKYHLVIVDEAGVVRNLSECWNAAIRPTLADYQGRAIIEGTPKGAGDFARMFSKGMGEDSEWKSWRYKTIDNPCIQSSEIESARADMPEVIFQQEFEGVPDDAGGNPFGLKAIGECVQAEPSTEKTAAIGVDLARSIDWTVATGLDRDCRWTTRDRFQMSWNETKKRLVDIIEDKPALVDATGVGSPIVEELQEKCPNVEGFVFTPTSKQQLMEMLQSSVHRQAVGIPDGDWQAEMETFGYEYTRTGVRYEAPQGYHDDCVCSLALAVRAVSTMPQVSPVIFDARPRIPTESERIAAFMNGDDAGSTSIFRR